MLIEGTENIDLVAEVPFVTTEEVGARDSVAQPRA
jgi:hypothetical protein